MLISCIATSFGMVVTVLNRLFLITCKEPASVSFSVKDNSAHVSECFKTHILENPVLSLAMVLSTWLSFTNLKTLKHIDSTL